MRIEVEDKPDAIEENKEMWYTANDNHTSTDDNALRSSSSLELREILTESTANKELGKMLEKEGLRREYCIIPVIVGNSQDIKKLDSSELGKEIRQNYIFIPWKPPQKGQNYIF